MTALGLDQNVSEVRVGKHIELTVEADDVERHQVEEIGDRLLANPVIETVIEGSGGGTRTAPGSALGSRPGTVLEMESADEAAHRRDHVPGLPRRPRRRCGPSRRIGGEPVSRVARATDEAPPHRRGDPPRRVLLRRPPAVRRSRRGAGDGAPSRARRGRRPGGRHLQRIPDPLRGRPAARGTPLQPHTQLPFSRQVTPLGSTPRHRGGARDLPRRGRKLSIPIKNHDGAWFGDPALREWTLAGSWSSATTRRTRPDRMSVIAGSRTSTATCSS